MSGNAWTLGSGARWRVLATAVVVCAVLLRLVYFARVELLPEETYYWLYSKHLDLGYLDHPPMVAWLIRLGTSLFGDSEPGVRFGALCCAGAASFFAFRLTRNLFGTASAWVALVLMQVLPFFFLAGLLMTPDAPLTASWAAALYFLERALVARRGSAWLPAGICIGLGLVSKYTIGMLVPAMALFVLLDPPSRRWLFRWEPYVALVLAFAIFSPVLIWNAEHEWASFAFQTSRRLAEAPRFSLHKLLLSALVLLTPTGFLTLLMLPSGRGMTAGSDAARAWRFLQVATGVPLAVFVIFSLRHDVKIDWTGALWLGAVPALASAIVSWGGKGVAGLRSWIASAWSPTAVIFLLLYGVGLHYLASGLPGVEYSEHMELVPVGWRDLGRQVALLAADVHGTGGEAPLVVGMDRYSIASELTFYAPDRAAAVRNTSSGHFFGQAGLMYERWFPASAQTGRTLLLVGWSAADIADSRLAAHVGTLDPIREGVLSRDGIQIRHFYYRVAHGFDAKSRG